MNIVNKHLFKTRHSNMYMWSFGIMTSLFAHNLWIEGVIFLAVAAISDVTCRRRLFPKEEGEE